MAKRNKANGKGSVVSLIPHPTSTKLPSAAVVCAENISLLHLLDNIQNPPMRNHIPDARVSESGRALSFASERSLCGAFAFIASIDDNSNHIPAVCLEERPETKSLKVVLAMNKETATDCVQVLERIKVGFEEIFRVLSEMDHGHGVADHTNASDVENEVFTAIVTMCSNRILRRLRLQGKRAKQPIQVLLQTAIVYYSLPLHYGPTYSVFLREAREIEKLVSSWKQYQHPSSVRSLVKGIFHLSRLKDIKQIIGEIPNSMMDPDSRKSLRNMIEKVSRYREVSRHIYRTARRLRIVRRGEVCVVDLPETAFDKSINPSYTPSLTIAAQRTQIIKGGEEDTQQMCKHLKDKSGSFGVFQKQTQKTLTEAKIHAEIQIVYHYLLNPAALPPRVVSSSKNACYLCNAFLNLGKTFHTPRCHGRLYPGWRIPFIPGLQEIAGRFNQELGRRVVAGYSQLMTPAGRKSHPPPQESTLLTLNWSKSTISAMLSSRNHSQADQTVENVDAEPLAAEGSLQRIEEEQQGLKPELHKFDSEEQKPQYRKEAEVSGSPGVQYADEEDRKAEKPDPVKSASSIALSSIATTERSQVDVSGKLLPGETSVIFCGGRPEIQIENPTGSTRPLAFTIEWLEESQVEKSQGTMPVHVFKAESIIGEVTYPLDGGNVICISQGAQIARINIQ